MSELMVYKANELVLSRYDLTEHETKLILCCVSLLNPTIEKPNKDERTIKIGYQKYAQIMGLSFDNAYHRLNKAASDLMTKTVEIIYQDSDIEKIIFQWVNLAKFNRKDQSLELVFSEDIIPYLFQLKKFIKYNLEHVKAFTNKYSMRVYEFLLKELTQRKTQKANIQISIAEFKFMLMLENHKSYNQFFEFNRKVLIPILNDINTYSNMTLFIEKTGRPATHLIFQVELKNKIDKLNNQESPGAPLEALNNTKLNKDSEMYGKIDKMLTIDSMHKIKLSKFESKFLNDMKVKYELNGSFNWLTEKQWILLVQIINKYKI